MTIAAAEIEYLHVEYRLGEPPYLRGRLRIRDPEAVRRCKERLPVFSEIRVQFEDHTLPARAARVYVQMTEAGDALVIELEELDIWQAWRKEPAATLREGRGAAGGEGE